MLDCIFSRDKELFSNQILLFFKKVWVAKP